MTAADRTLYALVITLVVSAPFVRPVWRAIDPGPADFLRARASLQAREPVDPWGTPWIRTSWVRVSDHSRLTELVQVGSAGPDTRADTPDDLQLGVQGRSKDGDYSIVGVGPRVPMASPAWSYRSLPAVPVIIAAILLLTRWVSGGLRPGPSRVGRAFVACGLASAATFLVVLVLAVNGAWELVDPRPLAGLIPSAATETGSLYLLLTAAIFAHREMHHLQKSEGGADAPTSS